MSNNNTVKSCTTCDRRNGMYGLGSCEYTGNACRNSREFPEKCGQNFENGWVQRRPFWKRLFWINK